MAHILYLQVEDSMYNNEMILVKDLSAWDPNLEILERLFQVLPPYGEKYIIVPLPMNQITPLTSKNLDLSKKKENLPDGLYKMHYSVSPNNRIFLDFSHFRVANLMNKILGKMASVGVDDLSMMDACGNVELNKQENTLIHAWMLLRGAQAVGIDSYNGPKAQALYNQSLRIYDRLFGANCINC